MHFRLAEKQEECMQRKKDIDRVERTGGALAWPPFCYSQRAA
jgi:hypothetical protein